MNSKNELTVLVTADGPLILLSDLCKKYLGISYDRARRLHAMGKLALPAFRLGNAGKGALYVHEQDFNALLAKRRESAQRRVPS